MRDAVRGRDLDAPFKIEVSQSSSSEFVQAQGMATEVERAAFQGDRVVMRGRSFTESGLLLTMRHQFRPLRVDRNHSAVLAANPLEPRFL